MGYVNDPGGVTAEFVQSSRYEINVNGTRCTATAHLRAPYDPERRKILA
jgi:4-methylaminobutanoate oxidase (formaldehyde-forming)